MKRHIEIFTAGCPICEPVVALVMETACKNCEITVYNLTDQSENKAVKAGVKKLPAIVVDGKLRECCKNVEITKADLRNAGVGNC